MTEREFIGWLYTERDQTLKEQEKHPTWSAPWHHLEKVDRLILQQLQALGE